MVFDVFRKSNNKCCQIKENDNNSVLDMFSNLILRIALILKCPILRFKRGWASKIVSHLRELHWMQCKDALWWI